MLLDPAQVTQRPDLETAGVGQDRPVPAHELVQTAQFFDDVCAGAQHQVVGVAEDNAGIDVVGEIGRGQALDRRLRADRHEDRCFHDAVGQRDAAATGVSGLVGFQQFESQGRHGGAVCPPEYFMVVAILPFSTFHPFGGCMKEMSA